MTIVRTPAAQADILAIWSYIAKRHLPAADATVRRIDQKMTLLEQQPQIGTLRYDGPGARSVVIDRYVMVYRPIAGGIEVLRVLHGARDIATALADD